MLEEFGSFWAIIVLYPDFQTKPSSVVVWNIFCFPIQLRIIIPTDELHYFSEG